jgi:hypothetical protein
MVANRLLKNPTGRRCEQKAPRQRLLAQSDGHTALAVCCVSRTVFHQPSHISVISVIRGKICIRVYSCSFAVKKSDPK